MISYIPLLILLASGFLFGVGLFVIKKSDSHKSVKRRWIIILVTCFAIAGILSVLNLKQKERIVIQLLVTSLFLGATLWNSFITWNSLRRHHERLLKLSAGIISIGLIVICCFFLKDIQEVVPLLKYSWQGQTWNSLGLRVGAPLLPAAILGLALEKIKQKALKRRKQ